jgi:hypothetical protein
MWNEKKAVVEFNARKPGLFCTITPYLQRPRTHPDGSEAIPDMSSDPPIECATAAAFLAWAEDNTTIAYTAKPTVASTLERVVDLQNK